jgi:hypothetical protein
VFARFPAEPVSKENPFSEADNRLEVAVQKALHNFHIQENEYETEPWSVPDSESYGKSTRRSPHTKCREYDYTYTSDSDAQSAWPSEENESSCRSCSRKTCEEWRISPDHSLRRWSKSEAPHRNSLARDYVLLSNKPISTDLDSCEIWPTTENTTPPYHRNLYDEESFPDNDFEHERFLNEDSETEPHRTRGRLSKDHLRSRLRETKDSSKVWFRQQKAWKTQMGVNAKIERALADLVHQKQENDQVMDGIVKSLEKLNRGLARSTYSPYHCNDIIEHDQTQPSGFKCKRVLKSDATLDNCLYPTTISEHKLERKSPPTIRTTTERPCKGSSKRTIPVKRRSERTSDWTMARKKSTDSLTTSSPDKKRHERLSNKPHDLTRCEEEVSKVETTAAYPESRFICKSLSKHKCGKNNSKFPSIGSKSSNGIDSNRQGVAPDFTSEKTCQRQDIGDIGRLSCNREAAYENKDSDFVGSHGLRQHINSSNKGWDSGNVWNKAASYDAFSAKLKKSAESIQGWNEQVRNSLNENKTKYWDPPSHNCLGE